MENRHIIRVLLSFLCISAAPSLVAAYWPVFHGNSQHNGLVKEPGILKPVIKWKFEGEGIFTLHSPVIRRDGVIYAVKGTTDYLTGNDAVYALTPDGKVKWKYTRPDLRFSPVVLSNDGSLILAVATRPRLVMIADTRDSYLLAIDSESGKPAWEKRMSSEYTEPWVSHIVTDSKARIYARAGDVLAALTGNGEKLWSYKTVAIPGKWLNEHTTGPTLSPDEKTVYFLKRNNGGLVAFDAETGKTKWHDKTAYYNEWSSPVVAPDGNIYIPDLKTFYSIDPYGKHRWKRAFEQEDISNSIAAIGMDGTVYVTAEDKKTQRIGGTVYAIDPGNGDIKWKYKIERGSLASPPAIDKDGRIYIGAGDGYVYCLNPDGTLLWKILVGYEVKKEEELKRGDYTTQIYMSGIVLSNGNLYVVIGMPMTERGTLVAVGSR